MSKSSVHNRKITAGAVLALISFASCNLAVAETPEPSYTMTVIMNNAQGLRVAKGKYERAIEKISARRASLDPFAESTNLCVAYTKVGRLEDADTACNAALESSDSNRDSVLAVRHSQRLEREQLAIALSNRGVLYAVKGNLEAAERDFNKALSLDTELSAPRVNLARLAKGAVATAT